MPPLTIGRTLLATALAALVLAALAAVSRVSTSDRALLVLEALGGSWTYIPAPIGAPGPVVAAVSLNLPGRPTPVTDEAIGRLHAALMRLPHLWKLDILRSGATNAQHTTSTAGLSYWTRLDLNGSKPVDDAMLAALRGNGKLREHDHPTQHPLAPEVGWRRDQCRGSARAQQKITPITPTASFAQRNSRKYRQRATKHNTRHLNSHPLARFRPEPRRHRPRSGKFGNFGRES